MGILEIQKLKAACIEVAKGYSQDMTSLLDNAQKLWNFISDGQ